MISFLNYAIWKNVCKRDTDLDFNVIFVFLNGIYFYSVLVVVYFETNLLVHLYWYIKIIHCYLKLNAIIKWPSMNWLNYINFLKSFKIS